MSSEWTAEGVRWTAEGVRWTVNVGGLIVLLFVTIIMQPFVPNPDIYYWVIVPTMLLAMALFTIAMWIWEHFAKNMEKQDEMYSCIRDICVTTDASIIDVAHGEPKHNILELSYKCGNAGGFYKIVTINYGATYQRIKRVTKEALEASGFSETLDDLISSRAGSHRFYPHLKDTYEIECAKAEYDAFDGNAQPVTLILYPYRSTSSRCPRIIHEEIA